MSSADPRARWSSVIGRLVLPGAIALCLLWTVGLTITGGVDFRDAGIPFRSRDPLRPALAASVLALIWVVGWNRHATRIVSWSTAFALRRAQLIAILLSVLALVIGVQYGTYVAGGADAYGYVSQSDLWLKGNLVIEQPMSREVPWEFAPWTFSPVGYRPTLSGDAIVPIYAPGLPLLMAAATLLAGACGPYLIVPILGALSVWMTYRLGERLWSRPVGLVAAALLVASPTFLFMLVTPMADVPSLALWVTAVVASLGSGRASAFGTGLIVAAALLVRPNLVPLATVLGGWFIWRDRQASGWQQVAHYVVGVAPAAIAIAALHTVLYGSPLQSGYGDLEGLYRPEYLRTNLVQFASWLLKYEAPMIATIVAPLLLWRRLPQEVRPAIGYAVLFALGVWLCYVFYIPLEPWWALRFLLPAFPTMLLVAVIGWRLLLSALAPDIMAATLAAMALVGATWQIDQVRDERIMRNWEGETVYVTAGQYVRDHLPQNAILISMMHSGSLRLYGQRLTLRYEWLAPEWWPRVLDVLLSKGYRPYILVSDWEEAQFRDRFRLTRADAALGTLLADLERPSVVRLYDPLKEPTPFDSPDRMQSVTPCPCPWQRR